MRSYCLSHCHRGRCNKFSTSLLAFAGFARDTASKLTSFLACWLVTPCAQTGYWIRMHRRHSTRLQSLACAVYLISVLCTFSLMTSWIACMQSVNVWRINTYMYCALQVTWHWPPTFDFELANERRVLVWSRDSSLLWLVNPQYEWSSILSSDLQSTVKDTTGASEVSPPVCYLIIHLYTYTLTIIYICTHTHSHTLYTTEYMHLQYTHTCTHTHFYPLQWYHSICHWTCFC